jgi:DNA polymerase III delta prime subunit
MRSVTGSPGASPVRQSLPPNQQAKSGINLTKDSNSPSSAIPAGLAQMYFMGMNRKSPAARNPILFGASLSEKGILKALSATTFTTDPIIEKEGKLFYEPGAEGTVLQEPVTYTLGQLLVILLQNRHICDGAKGPVGFPPHIIAPGMQFISHYSTILAGLGFATQNIEILGSLNKLGLTQHQPGNKNKNNGMDFLRGLRFKPHADKIAQAWLDSVQESALTEQKKETMDFSQRLLNAEKILGSRVIGQDPAVKLVATNLRGHYGGAVQPEHPLSFLFIGPSGVGKTELSLAIQELLTGDEKDLIKIDMGNIKESHHLDTWFGPPKGYKGHEEGGALTNRLNKAHQSNQKIVVLLDEIEKGHPEAFDRFLGALDKGELVDNTGEAIDIRNVVFVMTTNLGESDAKRFLEKNIMGFAPQTEDSKQQEASDIRKNALKTRFRPEDLNRIDETIPFQALHPEHQKQIFDMKLDRYIERFQKGKYKANLSFSNRSQLRDFLMKNLAQTGTYDFHSGGRLINKFIDRHLGNALNEYLLGENESGQEIPPGAHLEANLGDDGKITFKWLNRKGLKKAAQAHQLATAEPTRDSSAS